MKCTNGEFLEFDLRRKLEEIQSYLKRADFWPNLHEICEISCNVENLMGGGTHAPPLPTPPCKSEGKPKIYDGI